MRVFTWWLMQDPETAALATVRAAVDPAAAGGDYFSLRTTKDKPTIGLSK
ncbi:hypothetical protein [Nocardia aurantia]|nr:hypothetical protein [Nocardia aurantia]